MRPNATQHKNSQEPEVGRPPPHSPRKNDSMGHRLILILKTAGLRTWDLSCPTPGGLRNIRWFDGHHARVSLVAEDVVHM